MRAVMVGGCAAPDLERALAAVHISSRSSRSMIVAALAVMRLIYNSFDECEVPRFIAAAA
jgi:hypothetical protein